MKRYLSMVTSPFVDLKNELYQAYLMFLVFRYLKRQALLFTARCVFFEEMRPKCGPGAGDGTVVAWPEAMHVFTKQDFERAKDAVAALKNTA